MWLAIGERGLESLHLLLPFHGLFLSANTGADASASGGRRKRVWGQRRMRLGAETDASGSRGGRVWEQRRMQTGRSSLTSWEFVFTRHPGGPLRVWFALHQACRPRLASESKLTDGSYNISKSVGKIILNLPRALFFDLKRSTN